MMDRVLSADCRVWMEGHDRGAQALELVLPLRIADALVQGHATVEQLGGGQHDKRIRLPLVLAACGSRSKFKPAYITVAGCPTPVVSLSGLVTTAPVARVQGHLVRQAGLYPNPVVEEAGFISVPRDMVRQRRKEILGFDLE